MLRLPSTYKFPHVDGKLIGSLRMTHLTHVSREAACAQSGRIAHQVALRAFWVKLVQQEEFHAKLQAVAGWTAQ